MPREIEIKFAVGDEEEIARLLTKIGAEKVSEGLEHNEVFDNGEIRRKGILLRLRTYNGKAKLTFKTTIRKLEFKEADETEIEISDFHRAKEILQKLGFGVFWIYEKKKTKFLLGATKISLDRLPFATFMEIEGSEAGIRSAIAKLGLDPAKGIRETYLELYKNYCKKTDDEIENLVFWKKTG
jgi:adenylate cyclase class 2